MLRMGVNIVSCGMQVNFVVYLLNLRAVDLLWSYIILCDLSFAFALEFFVCFIVEVKFNGHMNIT
jgi:hypothetical protein